MRFTSASFQSCRSHFLCPLHSFSWAPEAVLFSLKPLPLTSQFSPLSFSNSKHTNKITIYRWHFGSDTSGSRVKSLDNCWETVFLEESNFSRVRSEFDLNKKCWVIWKKDFQIIFKQKVYISYKILLSIYLI